MLLELLDTGIDFRCAFRFFRGRCGLTVDNDISDVLAERHCMAQHWADISVVQERGPHHRAAKDQVDLSTDPSWRRTCSADSAPQKEQLGRLRRTLCDHTTVKVCACKKAVCERGIHGLLHGLLGEPSLLPGRKPSWKTCRCARAARRRRWVLFPLGWPRNEGR